MIFRFKGLSRAPFESLFGLNDEVLLEKGGRRVLADAKPGFPCRVTLEDAEPGESLLLVPYLHQPAHSPYRASGPIFIREKPAVTFDGEDVPQVLRTRLLSVRAYDESGMMVAADVTEGDAIEPLLAQFFDQENVDNIHVHFAKRGCFACRVERA
jgi:hypothetical protein